MKTDLNGHATLTFESGKITSRRVFVYSDQVYGIKIEGKSPIHIHLPCFVSDEMVNSATQIVHPVKGRVTIEEAPMGTNESISIKEMKVLCLIHGEDYPDTSQVTICIVQDEVYWLRDGQWWDYPRTEKSSGLL